MSVAGILDALRSDRPFSERLVWQCLENHANGARFWAITIHELMAELHIKCRSTVTRAIAALEDDKQDGGPIVRAVRRRKHKTVYHMLRVYPEKNKVSEGSDIATENQTLSVVATENQTLFEPVDLAEEVKIGLYPAKIESEKASLNPPVRKNPPASSRACPRDAAVEEEKKAAPDDPKPGRVWLNGCWVDPPAHAKPKHRNRFIDRWSAMGSPGDNGEEVIGGFDVATVTARAVELARIAPSGHDQAHQIRLWLRAGIEPSEIFAAISKCGGRANYTPPFSLGYFDQMVSGRPGVVA